MSYQYEAVGLTREQAIEVGEILCGGSFYLNGGHAWASETTIIRPMGCQCGHCKEFNKITPDVNE